MIRFGSRGSKLALTQTRLVAAELERCTGEEFEIEVIETRGDTNLAQPLASIGGKGLFTAELEDALRSGRIDVAVHSLKDLPIEDPEGLVIGAIPVREDPHDVLVFRPSSRDPEGGTVPLLGTCVVGTSSPRRCSSLLSLRSDLEPRDIRGNIDTRARKVADGDYDATILAAAGLNRLGLDTPGLERVELPIDAFTPAPGQGALGIQCRADDGRVRDLLAAIHDETTAACVNAERGLLFALGGGCSMPLGALVEKFTDQATFRMRVSLASDTRPTSGVQLDLAGSDPEELTARAAETLRPLLGEPLAGQSVALLRPGGDGGKLARALGFAGADVETVAVSEILPIFEHTETLRSADLACVAFTSARAVDRFFEQAAAFGLDLSDARIYAGGPATAAAVHERGLGCSDPTSADIEGAGGLALAGLIRMSEGPSRAGLAVLFPCAENRHPEFESEMQAAGIAVRPVPVYRTIILPGVEIPDVDHLIFTSPSAVHAFAKDRDDASHRSALALGSTTAIAMQTVGIAPRSIADAPTAQALVQMLRDLS